MPPKRSRSASPTTQEAVRQLVAEATARRQAYDSTGIDALTRPPVTVKRPNTRYLANLLGTTKQTESAPAVREETRVDKSVASPKKDGAVRKGRGFQATAPQSTLDEVFTESYDPVLAHALEQAAGPWEAQAIEQAHAKAKRKEARAAIRQQREERRKEKQYRHFDRDDFDEARAQKRDKPLPPACPW